MEPPNKLMIMQALGLFRYDYMILNGLIRIFSGAPSVIPGVLGEISVIWPQLLVNDGGGEVVVKANGNVAAHGPPLATTAPSSTSSPGRATRKTHRSL